MQQNMPFRLSSILLVSKAKHATKKVVWYKYENKMPIAEYNEYDLKEGNDVVPPIANTMKSVIEVTVKNDD